MTGTDVVVLRDARAGEFSERAYGETADEKLHDAIERLKKAEALLAEMVSDRESGLEFRGGGAFEELEFAVCPFCKGRANRKHIWKYGWDSIHEETCPITRARQLLGIEV